MFDLDVTLDQVAIQSPANSGTLALTGKLGTDATRAGFDVFSELKDGRTVGNVGYAVLTTGGQSSVQRIDLLTGKAYPSSELAYPVADLAVALQR